MNKLRIVFMGTPDFAVGILNTLVQNSYDIAGVITAPDKPAGRGRKLQESAVKKYAVENDLKVLQPTNLKNEEFLEELKNLNANLQIIVAFRMLPKVVWDIPEFGTFNLHASLLPDYRGAAPINWAIINGETKTGVTTFFIDDKIDTGEIILQSKTDITPDETAGTLHDKLMLSGADLVLKTVKTIEEGKVITQPQPQSHIEKVAYKIHKDTCEIDWTKPIDDIYNHIRGLSPYPASWTTLYNNKEELFLKIYDVAMEKENHSLKTKTIIFDKKTIKVVVAGGYIQLLEIQLPGKRKMKTQDVLNGLKLEKNAQVG
ncbi:methionyl-tRNA formyltransferase [Cellulophaga sp. HaHaR_3_176]|uniref:methionyl-tRNA formyltransferase n=1 Tax=Cellulophaga sp. HaHaR_3_176 TaxID=1942464 RepID=UPI001C1F8718|nr:methionyl-tRNA formyltransferase [Cellulophaga sp. HaHaR_3_176]QWX84896.1 methionyl-tRNA formyltransferase [Cellulophaga sp. HaHaR_3_176]